MPVTEVFDAIVVGSGASGSWAAKDLTERGLRVLLLEAGRDIDPEKDFPVTPPAGNDMLSRVRGGLTGQHVQARCSSYNAMTSKFFVKDSENPYTTPRGKPFNWFRGRQLGGRLHTWARLSLRMSDHEFKAGGRDGFGFDWPICYADLAPYYDRVEDFLGLDGGNDGLDVVPDGRPTRPIPPTARETDFRQALAKDWGGRPVIGSRVIRHNPARIPKQIRAGRRTDRLVVRTDAVAARVLVDSDSGKARGVLVIDRKTKRSDEVLGKVVVLCASTIETLRILLNSTSAQHPAGLGNSSGNLGRYLMDHTMVGVDGRIPEDDFTPEAPGTDPYDIGRVNGLYIPRFRNVGGDKADYLRGFGIQGAIARARPNWWLLSFGEVLPHAKNTVTLDHSKTDAWGIPVACIDYENSDNEERMIDDQIATLKEIAHIAGLEISPPGGRGVLNSAAFNMLKGFVLSRDNAFVPGASIHEVGGAPMGDDPKTFVLNKFNQCWDAKNVFVTDGSCFVSSGCQNSTLTIMALTARACDYLVQEYAAGNL